MICLICGMKVTSRSFDFNKYSFIEKNTEQEIINCPFCGVSKVYLDNQKNVYNVEKSLLDKQTIKILDNAMKLEVFNGEFYEEASKLAKSESLKKMFKDLSNIEFMHAKVHKRLGGFSELPKLHKPDYTRHNTDKLLLEEANKREEHAVLFYMRNMSKVSSEIVKKVFKALSEVEKQHIDLTNK